MASNKIPLLIIRLISKLLKKAIPAITTIVEKTGIQNIGQPNVQMPGTCLPKDELLKILRIRNGLIDALNAVAKIIKTLKIPLNILSILLRAVRLGLDISKITRLVANTVLLAIPPPIPVPGGQIPAGINTLKDLEELLRPIVTITSNSIDFVTIALDYANSIIFKLLGILKSIDVYLIGCGVSSSELTQTDDYIKQVDEQYTEVQRLLSTSSGQKTSEVYREFLLEIVEEPYSPTVNRRKAVAKNKDGIILLSTPLSFATDNQTLLDQIKLVIDTNYANSPPENVTTTSVNSIININSTIENAIPPLPPLPPSGVSSGGSSSPSPSSNTSQFIEYDTKPFDTFRKIALKYNISVKSIEDNNRNLNFKDFRDLSTPGGITKRVKLKIPKS